MNVERVLPIDPEFRLRFTRHEGWAVVMALKDAVHNYPEARDREAWQRWADELDRLLRAD